MNKGSARGPDDSMVNFPPSRHLFFGGNAEDLGPYGLCKVNEARISVDLEEVGATPLDCDATWTIPSNMVLP